MRNAKEKFSKLFIYTLANANTATPTHTELSACFDAMKVVREISPLANEEKTKTITMFVCVCVYTCISRIEMERCDRN